MEEFESCFECVEETGNVCIKGYGQSCNGAKYVHCKRVKEEKKYTPEGLWINKPLQEIRRQGEINALEQHIFNILSEISNNLKIKNYKGGKFICLKNNLHKIENLSNIAQLVLKELQKLEPENK